MKRFARTICLLAVLLFGAMHSHAQLSLTNENALDYSDKRYLTGAIPMEDGKVVFNKQLDITGIPVGTAMELVKQWVKGSLADDGFNGKVHNIDDNAGCLAINVDGDLTFKSTAFQLDKATIILIMDIKFTDNRCLLTFKNIRYLYAINPNNAKRDLIVAEKWITDKEALNKAGTKMYATNGKFRIRTIQLVDYLTESLRKSLNAKNVDKKVVQFSASTEAASGQATSAGAISAGATSVEATSVEATSVETASDGTASQSAAQTAAEASTANNSAASANTGVVSLNITTVNIAKTGSNNTAAYAKTDTKAENSVSATADNKQTAGRERNDRHYNFVKDMNGFEKISPMEIEGNAIKMISKEWMLVTAGTEKDFNMLTASWGGFGELYNKSVAICFIRPDRYTYNYIDNEDTFTLTFYSEDFREVLNYCGSASGRDEDKVKGSRLTPLMLPDNKGIAFRQAKLIIECRKLVSMPITADAIEQPDVKAERTKYPLHKMFIGEIVAVYKK